MLDCTRIRSNLNSTLIKQIWRWVCFKRISIPMVWVFMALKLTIPSQVNELSRYRRLDLSKTTAINCVYNFFEVRWKVSVVVADPNLSAIRTSTFFFIICPLKEENCDDCMWFSHFNFYFLRSITKYSKLYVCNSDSFKTSTDKTVRVWSPIVFEITNIVSDYSSI